MQNITVNKSALLDKLRENRDDHVGLFLKAQEAYRKKLIEVLDDRLAQARADRKVSTYIAMPEPVDYTEEFEKAIAMVEWAEGDTIDLSEKDFSRYVLNKWEWAAAFATNTTAYLED